jgi:hypothetical protein
VEQPLWTRSADKAAALARIRIEEGKFRVGRGDRAPPKTSDKDGDALRSSQKLSLFATRAKLRVNKTLSAGNYYSLMFKGWLIAANPCAFLSTVS